MVTGEDYTGWELDFQAQALAEKTINAPLAALAQLCPLAEALIEQVVAMPQEPPQEARELLGLETMEDVHWFFDSIIFRVRQSPQDILAQYLYQGQAARKAGVPPREWLRVHRLVHLAALQLPHHFKHGIELSADLREVFFLEDTGAYASLRELHAQADGTLPTRLKMLSSWQLQLRKVAAAGLLRREHQAHSHTVGARPEHHSQETSSGPQPRRSARIPLRVSKSAPAPHPEPTPAMA